MVCFTVCEGCRGYTWGMLYIMMPSFDLCTYTQLVMFVAGTCPLCTYITHGLLVFIHITPSCTVCTKLELLWVSWYDSEKQSCGWNIVKTKEVAWKYTYVTSIQNMCPVIVRGHVYHVAFAFYTQGMCTKTVMHKKRIRLFLIHPLHMDQEQKWGDEAHIGSLVLCGMS